MIRISVNNRPIRPECITVIESPLPWIERRVNWERYRNWLAVRGDCTDSAALVSAAHGYREGEAA